MSLGFWGDLPDRGVCAAEVAAVLPAEAAVDMGETVKAFAPKRRELQDDMSVNDVPEEPITDLLVRGRAWHRIAYDGVFTEGSAFEGTMASWQRTATVRPEELPADTVDAAVAKIGPESNTGVVQIAVVLPNTNGWEPKHYCTQDGVAAPLTDRALVDERERFEGHDSVQTKKQKLDALTGVSGVGPNKAEALYDAGFETPYALTQASQVEIADAPGIGMARAARIKADVSTASTTTEYEFDEDGDGARESDEELLTEYAERMKQGPVPNSATVQGIGNERPEFVREVTIRLDNGEVIEAKIDGVEVGTDDALDAMRVNE